MSSQDKEFEEQLAEAGRKLLDPPSSVEDLLPLLDKAEYYLSRVEQSPSKSIESALSPCMKALVADKLFKHSDMDVKVAVASCISEITRISAPEAPYEDDLMKEAFQLIVSSFEHLDDKSSRSYEKRASILATVAKVRSCVVMLDLECDALILQMFQHFLKAIRDYHPEHVFTSMETVMTLVIEESEDISPELLSPILATVKKDNEGVLPVAKKLAEKVLENCASKLNAALGQALSSLGTSSDDYSEVVNLICRNNNAEKSRADVNAAAEHEVDNEATSPKSEVSSGVKQTAEDDPSTDSVSAKKHENADQKTEMEITGVSSDDKPVKSENGKDIKTARKPKKTTRKRGRKPSAVKKTKPADSNTEDEKEAAQSLDNEKDAKSDNDKDAKSDNDKDAKSDNDKDATSDNDKDATSNNDKDAKSDNDEDAKSDNDKDAKSDNDKDAKSEVPSLRREHSDGEKEAGVAPSPKEEENESMDVSSPSKSAEQKKKEECPEESEESEGPSDSEEKAHAEDEKKTEDEATDEDKTPISAKTSRKGSEATDDAETDSVKKSSQKVRGTTVDKDGASSKSLKQKKELVKGKVGRPKDKTNSSKKDAEKEAVSSSKSGKKRQRDEDQPDETPKNKVKGKRTPVKEVGSGAKEYGQDLVGSKVKVWWPEDAEFYKGVVQSFNPVSRRHRILYNDGDVETLRLKNEKWELVEDDSSSSEEQEAEEEARESSPDVPSKKSKASTGKAVKSSGKLKKGKPGSSVKGKPGSSKPKAKQSSEVDEDSEEESDKEKGVERSKTPGSMKKPPGSKTPGSKTPVSGTKTGGSKMGGSGMKTGSKTGKKRRRGT